MFVAAGDRIMRRAAALLATAFLCGCAGYAADYLRAERSIIAPQIERYGIQADQGRCVTQRLTESLGVWQLRQLERVARLVPPTHFGGSALSPRNLLTVAGHVEDDRVEPTLRGALEQCQVALAPMSPAAAAAEVAAATEASAPGEAGAAADAAPARSLWLNLGSAGTGQSIAVNATSISEEGSTREAWFRLTNPGETGASPNAYLLRIDCAARTLNSMAFRRFGPDGAVAEERDYRPDGEGVGPIAGGTVMEIAYLALCT
jgi:hypothetical protein